MTRAIIIAAGEAERWGNHMNVPKHLVEIDGEPILHRAVRLLLRNNINNIYVVSKDDPRYSISGSTQYVADLDYETNGDADKFLSSKNLWNTEGRTIVLLGDVFFSEEGMSTICNNDAESWTLFCREHGSKLTGTPWGECFAQSFYPSDIDDHEEGLEAIAKLHKEKILRGPAGWQHYRWRVGARSKRELRHHSMRDKFVNIDDWTDDFDYPEDYDRFMERWNRK